MWSPNGVEHRLWVNDQKSVDSDADRLTESTDDAQSHFSVLDAQSEANSGPRLVEQPFSVFVKLPPPLKCRPLTIS